MAAIGLKDAGDFNDGSILGYQWFQTTIDPKRQVRASSESTYLTAYKDLPNLTVFTKTLAKRVLFNAQKKATGVIVETSGTQSTPSIKREVVISAGVFQSPQLLMVSGIGPSDTLSKHNISLVYDNPHVGQNMRDRVWLGPTYRVNVETITKWANDAFYMLDQFTGPYQQHLQGPLTANAGDFGAFEKVPDDLRLNFTAEALEDLARFPND